MASRGSQAKEEITNKILEVFEGSFKYDKEIRIPFMESGDLCQIKVTLTCAKTNVEGGGETKIPGDAATEVAQSVKTDGFMNEPTEEEKQSVKSLCERLGLIS